MIKGQSGQSIGAQMINSATGAAFVGTVTIYITGDAGVQAIGSVGSGVCTAEGNGFYTYLPSATETNFDLVAFTFIGSGAIPATIQVATLNTAQVSALQSASGLGSCIVSELIADALCEIRVARAGDVLAPDDADFGLRKLNRLLDRWNADPRTSYVLSLTSFTPTVSHQPHTIGPSSADWAATQRPMAITGANLILNTVTPAIRIPLNIRDLDWWRDNAVQGIATSMPTDLYYAPDWPNGSVYLWPVPTATYPIELELDGTFNSVVLTDTFWAPFGYRDAITLTLAEECAPAFGQTVSQSTKDSARDARALIFNANLIVPNLWTRDGGVPGGDGGWFDYRTGRVR